MHECCCIDNEEAEFYDQRIVKARKIHHCCECHDIIKPEDYYEKTVGKWEGNWSEFKTCIICKRIRDDFFQCGYTHEWLKEELRECHGVEL